MRERTETGFELFPECKGVTFTVTEAATKGKTQKGKYYYLFRFTANIDGRLRKYTEAMMVWMSGDILRALGCSEIEKGVFDWDKAEIVGRQLVADIVHEADFKDPAKMVARLKSIRPVGGEAMAEPPPAPVGVGATTDEDIPF